MDKLERGLKAQMYRTVLFGSNKWITLSAISIVYNLSNGEVLSVTEQSDSSRTCSVHQPDSQSNSTAMQRDTIILILNVADLSNGQDIVYRVEEVF